MTHATPPSPRTPRSDGVGADHRTRSLRVGTAGSAALLLVGVASVIGMAPSRPSGLDAPAGAFSATRAMAHVSAVADDPRPVGSPGHREARAYLLDQLESLGWRTEVQESVGRFDFGGTGTQSLGAVANVIATIPGTAATGTVILTGHYDTVPGAPGAADDGIAIGVLLETARALGDGGTNRNTVMVLLTDAEEVGLLGAEAFVRERAGELGTTVVLNHEASGAGGAPIAFRTSTPNGELLEVLARAPGASADSGSEAVFASLSHDTDFTPFERGGMFGFDTAILADGAYYHSPLDDPAHLSAASLQQMGDTTLALTRELSAMDLGTIATGGNEIVLTLPWGLLRYPQRWETPLAIATLVLSAALVGALRWRRVLTLPRAGLAVVAAAAVLTAAGAAAYLVWWCALLVDPAQASAVLGQPYRPLLYRLAMLLAGLWIVVTASGLLRRRVGASGLAAGMLVLLALAGVLVTVTVPGLSGGVVQPTLVMVVGAVIAALLSARYAVLRTVVSLMALIGGTILLGPAIWIGFDVGLGSGPLSAALFAVLVTLTVPLLASPGSSPAGADSRRKRGAAMSALLLVATAACTGAGLAANREGATDPRQEQILYSVDADTQDAYWASNGRSASTWSAALLSRPVAPLDDAFPWRAGESLRHGPAPATDLPAPAVTVLRDVTHAGGRELTLRISSRRDAATLGMWVDARSATVVSATVDGWEVPTGRSRAKWDFGFRFYGAPATGVEVRLQVDPYADEVTLRVADSTHDLGVVPGFAPPPEGRVLVTPEVVVTRALTV